MHPNLGVHGPSLRHQRPPERLVAEGRVPWTILLATQFHDFAAMVTSWTEQDGAATVPPLLIQPIAPQNVADILAELAMGEPQGHYRDVAGPEPQDLVDMARRTNDARGRTLRLVPTWDPHKPPFGPEMAGDVLLPRADARIAPTTFDQWLDQQRPSQQNQPRNVRERRRPARWDHARRTTVVIHQGGLRLVTSASETAHP